MTSKLDYDNEGRNYYICEDLQFMRPHSEIKKLGKLWKEGKSLEEMAKELNWDMDEVAIAIIDRKRKGKIRNRKGGYNGYTCQKIGIKGGHLVAHHIQNFAQFPELRFAIDNGITLSKQAHNEFHKRYGRKNNNREQLDEFLGDLKIKLTPQ